MTRSGDEGPATGKKLCHGLKNGEQEVKCRAGGWKGFVDQKEAHGSWVGVFHRQKNGGQEVKRRAAGVIVLWGFVWVE